MALIYLLRSTTFGLCRFTRKVGVLCSPFRAGHGVCSTCSFDILYDRERSDRTPRYGACLWRKYSVNSQGVIHPGVARRLEKTSKQPLVSRHAGEWRDFGNMKVDAVCFYVIANPFSEVSLRSGNGWEAADVYGTGYNGLILFTGVAAVRFGFGDELMFGDNAYSSSAS